MPRTNIPNNPVNDDIPQDDDDIPEGFQLRDASQVDDDREQENDPSWNTPTPAEDDAEVDLETLAGFKINSERSAADREMLSAPSGDYVKVGRKAWVYKHDVIVGDKAKGDYSKKGRLFITFSGQIHNDTWKGMISFRISPDPRHGIDFQTKKIDTNKWDGMYKLWLQAEEYYLLQTGEEPTSVLDVADLLSKDDELVFRVMKGRDIGSGSFVMGFKKQG